MTMDLNNAAILTMSAWFVLMALSVILDVSLLITMGIATFPMALLYIGAKGIAESRDATLELVKLLKTKETPPQK